MEVYTLAKFIILAISLNVEEKKKEKRIVRKRDKI